MDKTWKKGRGKLGFLQPLLGRWTATAEGDVMGPVRCTRVFTPVLEGSYVRLEARWELGEGKVYEEEALIGAGDDGTVGFWSFTSDGKRSQGALADATDLHPEAIGFEAQMPAGLARMVYWPEEGGFVWVAESRNAKGWKRFVEHHYRPEPSRAST
jgi:hypothetical protein